ncbi:NADP-dependent oxidoreductase [Kitasatospora sp. NBC_01560]|uniref:NADP-dependent oxidoreductase n=1 Tax=Kitasatospora sp. NBC_01560 TaxID=2975965 RepID=UPI0038640D76
MRAQVNAGYGDASLLRPTTLPRPVPGEGELLVRTLFAGVNHVDWQIREGWFRTPGPARFPFVPGWDVCGVVEQAAGRFRVGDLIFAYCRSEADLHGDGAYAEYLKVRADSCAHAPTGVAPEQLSVLPLVCLTAVQAAEAAQLPPGARVLLSGANGAVGRQLLAFLVRQGHSVIAAAAPQHHGSLAEAGAQQVVDPRSPDHLRETAGAHALIDCGVGFDVPAAARLLVPGGRFVSIVGPPDEKQAAQAGVSAVHVFSRPDGARLQEVAALIEDGRIPLPRVEVLDLEEAALAQEKVRGGAENRYCLSPAR